jgi:hypothetical protein
LRKLFGGLVFAWLGRTVGSVGIERAGSRLK